MASSYPGAIDVSFPGYPYQDNVEFVLAASANSWVSALQAIENTVGAGTGFVIANPLYSPAYNQSFPTLAARVANAESILSGAVALNGAAGTIQPVGGAGAAGSSGLGARADHVHAGVTSFNGRQGVIVTLLSDLDNIYTASGQVLVGTGVGTASLQQISSLLPTSAWSPGDLKASTSTVVPSGWAIADGSALSRAGFATLFANTTYSMTVTFVNGNATISGIPAGIAQFLQSPMPVEGPGFLQAGTLISGVGSTSIQVSPAPTSGGSGTLTIFPYGNGDGSTTFNIIDARGRAIFGINNPGSGGSSNSQPSFGAQSRGGEQLHQLTPQEGSPHTHVVDVSDGGHQHQEYHGNYAAAITGGSDVGLVVGPPDEAPIPYVPVLETQILETNTGFAQIEAFTEVALGNSAGVTVSHNNMPPFAAALWLVKTT